MDHPSMFTVSLRTDSLSRLVFRRDVASAILHYTRLITKMHAHPFRDSRPPKHLIVGVLDIAIKHVFVETVNAVDECIEVEAIHHELPHCAAQ